jgi:hypothetical protein
MSTKIYKNEGLTLEVREDERAIDVSWIGKSTAREPGTFLSPILTDVLKQSKAANAAISMDFRQLEYMNSSTITPVIRMLNEAKRGDTRVAILYQDKLRWQELSFSALRIFQTDDKRIEIRGV